MKRPQKNNTRSGTTKKPSSRLRLTLTIAASITIALGLLLLWHFLKPSSPTTLTTPPTVSTQNFEPVVAALINESLNAVQQSPRDAQAWGRLGIVLKLYDQPAQARVCFTQAEALEPDNPRWPYFHGQLLLPDQRALPKLRQAVKLSGGNPDITRLRLANALAEHGHIDEARQQFDHFPARHPAAALGLANLSLVANDPTGAIQQLQPALNDPHTAKAAHTLLASIQYRAGNTTNAAATRTRADTLPPDLDWPDPFTQATQTYERGRKLLRDRAQLLLQRNQLGEAAPLVAQLLKDYPRAPEGWLYLARLQMSQNDCPAAENALRKHLELRPNSVNGLSELGTALLCQERYPDAAQVFTQVVQLKPDFGQAHFNLGFAQARAGNPAAAIDSFRQAIRFNPDFVDPYITLADLLGQVGQIPDALQLLDQARRLAPEDPRIDILTGRIQSR